MFSDFASQTSRIADYHSASEINTHTVVTITNSKQIMKNYHSTLVLILALISASHSDHVDHFPYCYDLADNSAATYITEDGFEKNACEWAGRADTNHRCQKEGVSDSCPITCELPCVTESPSLSPSSAPTGTISCEDRVENTEDFHVEGQDKKRSCEWAGRRDTSWRCLDDAVKWNCQVLCDLACVTQPTPPPVNFAQADSAPTAPRKAFPGVAIALVAIGGALLIGAVAISVRTKSKSDKSNNSSSNEEHNMVQFDEVDDTVGNEGYAGLCGWGSAQAKDPEEVKQPEPEKVKNDVEAKNTYYEPENKRGEKTRRTHHWSYRQY